MKFLLLLHGDESGFDDVPAAEMAQAAKEINAFAERHAAVMVESSSLTSGSQARTVRAGGVTDGPFTEAKEIIGGFHIVDVSSVDEAIAIAEDWPGVAAGWTSVEVRPMFEQCPVFDYLEA